MSIGRFRRNCIDVSQENFSQGPVCYFWATGILFLYGWLEKLLNITFPILMKEFEINTATVQRVTTIYLLAAACVVPLSAYSSAFKMKSIF